MCRSVSLRTDVEGDERAEPRREDDGGRDVVLCLRIERDSVHEPGRVVRHVPLIRSWLFGKRRFGHGRGGTGCRNVLTWVKVFALSVLLKIKTLSVDGLIGEEIVPATPGSNARVIAGRGVVDRRA